MHIISYATTAQSPFQMVVKSNTVSLRHNHSPETLIIHITQCIRNHFAFKILFSTKFYFQKFYLFENFIFRKFYQNLFDFIRFYLILFEFNKYFSFSKKFYFTMNGVHVVTQEKKTNESKRIENGPSAPSALPKARPGAQAARAPRAQRLPAARPAPCRAPSALPPACACAQLPRTPTRPLRSRATAACPRTHARLPACHAHARLPCLPARAHRPSPARPCAAHARPARALRLPSAQPPTQMGSSPF